ncbi:hypothetical protein G7046_g9053 [Stylonectria norvegica]|nr:hypothetical protein G7046_g9053 [Stylonectria norvegica]
MDSSYMIARRKQRGLEEKSRLSKARSWAIASGVEIEQEESQMERRLERCGDRILGGQSKLYEYYGALAAKASVARSRDLPAQKLALAGRPFFASARGRNHSTRTQARSVASSSRRYHPKSRPLASGLLFFPFAQRNNKTQAQQYSTANITQHHLAFDFAASLLLRRTSSLILVRRYN